MDMIVKKQKIGAFYSQLHMDMRTAFCLDWQVVQFKEVRGVIQPIRLDQGFV